VLVFRWRCEAGFLFGQKANSEAQPWTPGMGPDRAQVEMQDLRSAHVHSQYRSLANAALKEKVETHVKMERKIRDQMILPVLKAPT
jgi:hypothetical protein